MLSRSMRAETRNKAKDELKRVINSIHKVRKWEKKWVVVKDTTMKIFKWVPVSDSQQALPRIPMAEKKKPPIPVVPNDDEESRDADATRSKIEDSENSQEPFALESTRTSEEPVRNPATDFSNINEDSNTGFSEAGFESDSNPAFAPNAFAHPDDSTDFSTAFTETNDSVPYLAGREEEESLTGEEEPSAKRLKTM